MLSEKGSATDPKKIDTVVNWKTPENVKKHRSFLGFTSYYRRYIESYSQIAYPLHEIVIKCIVMMQKGIKEKIIKELWSMECGEAFNNLKRKLNTAPILMTVDY